MREGIATPPGQPTQYRDLTEEEVQTVTAAKKIADAEIQEELYKYQRESKYNSNGDQHDAILKQFKLMRDNGIEIHPELSQQIDDWLAVKTSFPK